MEEALERLPAAPGGPDLCGPLSSYLARHVAEERDHDSWILEDLAALGMRPEDVLAAMPSPAVASMVGAQYYWVRHHHPLVLVAYIAVLEGNPPSAQDVDDLVGRSGLPPDAFRTWREHAALDPGHGEELDALIDSLPLSDAQVGDLATNAVTTVRLATAAFRTVLS